MHNCGVSFEEVFFFLFLSIDRLWYCRLFKKCFALLVDLCSMSFLPEWIFCRSCDYEVWHTFREVCWKTSSWRSKVYFVHIISGIVSFPPPNIEMLIIGDCCLNCTKSQNLLFFWNLNSFYVIFMAGRFALDCTLVALNFYFILYSKPKFFVYSIFKKF